MKTSMLLALMTEGFTLIGVRFRQNNGDTPSRTLYHYKYPGTDIEVGDMAVVESPYDGFVIVDVETVDTDPVLDIDAGYSYKWAVQKVDTSAYYAHREREQALTKHLKRLKNKAVAEQTLATIRAELSGTTAGKEFEALVAELNSGLAKQVNHDHPVPYPYRSERIYGIDFAFWCENDNLWAFQRANDTANHKGYTSFKDAKTAAEAMVEHGHFAP